VVAVFAGTVACAKEHPPATLARSASQAAALPTREPVLEARPPMVDAGQPSIECPLAKQGIHPADLRPFKDTEKYIAFLEQPERAEWQRPDAVIAALSLAGNETVVDVGAGSGYFSFRLARALPRGMVVATDIQPEMVRHMHHKVMTEGLQNLRVVLGQADEPGIPPGADLVFVCDVLHHVPGQQAWLGKLAREMKAGARLALVEFKEGKLPQGPPENLKLPRSKLIELATNAGLVLDKEKPDLLPYQTFLVFRKP
jgi:SAM-dependent methyltransferase